ncbi:MAG: hypothetical protein A2Y40_01500 [Candidatus Margulisbacteria bacterium GWF2_35_9]|nr:MAG: hypothetical protein A2Y40_01500 [Candidatus Margulisbacteria bacterium GWF2_35_9]
MNKFETTAANYYMNGFNCAQAVLVAYKEELSIPEKELLKISCGFGAGMGRLQNTCGAVSGAYMVIGLKFGKDSKEDNDAREKTYGLVREFDLEFKRKHISSNCKELLNCDLLSEDGQKYFKENNLSETICRKCVVDSVSILNKLLKK